MTLWLYVPGILGVCLQQLADAVNRCHTHTHKQTLTHLFLFPTATVFSSAAIIAVITVFSFLLDRLHLASSHLPLTDWRGVGGRRLAAASICLPVRKQ